MAFLQPQIAHYRVPMYNRLVQQGHVDVTVYHSGSSRGLSGPYLREVLVSKCAFVGLKWQRGIIRRLQEYDVTVAMFDPHWISAMIAAVRTGRRGMILWGHGLGRSRLAVRPRIAVAKMVSAVVLYDHLAKIEFENLGVPPERLFVAPNTIAVPNHGRCAKSRRNEFLFVGRLQLRKRVADLLDAFAEAITCLPSDCSVRIVGDGVDKSRLMEKARSLGIAERVCFMGQVTDPVQLRDIFSRAIAYVSPGPVGLGVLHSFAYGVPVVTQSGIRHGPEVANVREGENGMFYQGGPSELAKIMRSLVQQHLLAKQMGESAYEWYSRHRRIDHMVDGFLKAIEFTHRTKHVGHSGL